LRKPRPQTGSPCSRWTTRSAVWKVDPGLAGIVELRTFGGLTIDEAAHVLKVSPSTVKREWRTAKAWLTRELAPENRP
jgi:DNA-directed RNA polymerase specialized sigma24 family protein